MSVSAIQALSPPHTYPSLHAPTRLSTYTHSTLSPSLSKTTPSSPIHKFIRNLDRLHECGNNSQALCAKQLEDYLRTAEEIQKKRSSCVEQVNSKQNQNELWSIIGNIGTCVSSATFMVIGTSMISSGVGIPMGMGLIASSVLSIATVIGSTTGAMDALAYHCALDDAEKRALYKSLFPLCAQVASGALGVYGLANGVGIAALGGHIADIANTATNIAQGIAMAGQGITQADIERLNSSMVDVEQMTLACQNGVERQMRDLKFMLDESARTTQAASELMQMLASATKEIMV